MQKFSQLTEAKEIHPADQKASKYKGATFTRDGDGSEHYTAYHVSGHGGEHRIGDKSDAYVTHYHYGKNKPSYIGAAKHEKIKKEGAYTVRTPDHYGIYDRSEDKHFKTAAAAKKHAATVAVAGYKNRVGQAHAAASMHSYRNFSQHGNRS